MPQIRHNIGLDYFEVDLKKVKLGKVSSSNHLCVECFSQLSFDSEVYTKSATAADFAQWYIALNRGVSKVLQQLPALY